ncbi:MAG: outer membrane lipoprotein-sorting protein [Thermodesulfobacteriota bacterium]
MSGKGRVSALLIAALLLLPLLPGRALALSASEILDRVDDLYRGKSSSGKMTMAITTEHWQRTLSMDMWSKGKDMSLIRITAPAKEQGTATLRVKNEIWNYLPKVNRVIKLPSSMMSASWMGSHFTNDDLVKESRFTDDYTFSVTGERKENGHTIVDITCIPKPDAAVVWGKVVVTADADEFLPLKSLYYDEDGDLARTMVFSDVQKMGDRILPLSLVIYPADKPKEKTEVHYDQINFDQDLPDDFFSLRNLQK